MSTEEKRIPPFRFGYLNHRGEYGERVAIPTAVVFAKTEWHPDEQWLMHAIDVEKEASRTFAMRDMFHLRAPGELTPIGRAEAMEMLGALVELNDGLGDLAYRKAKPLMNLVASIRDSIEATFPGGFAGNCDYCDRGIGHDEIGASDPVNGGHACKTCVAKDPARSRQLWRAPSGRRKGRRTSKGRRAGGACMGRPRSRHL